MPSPESVESYSPTPDEEPPSSRSSAEKVWRVVLPLLVLVAGVAGAVVLVLAKPEPKQSKESSRGPLVDTHRLTAGVETFAVDAQGTVEGARRVEVVAQVSGQVVSVNEDLVPGGIVRKGDQLFRIDPTDYHLALRQTRAQRAQAEAELKLESARARVAEREWEIYRQGKEETTSEEPPPLPSREPQQEAARQQLESSQAKIAQQRVDIARTTYEAPLDAFVEEERLEVGSQVGPQTVVATLVGIDRFWVRTSVPLEELAYVDLPDMDGSGGSTATIRLKAGALEVERQGRVVRLLGNLDDTSRLATLLVEVEDPFGLADETEEGRRLPLLTGSYVDVTIEGNRSERLIRVPREALHGDDQVYVFRDGRLDIVETEVVRRRDDVVLVAAGLAEGDRVVTTRLSQPVDGMPLRDASEEGPNG